MSYEYFYPGTPYSLDAGYGDLFTGYRLSASRIGVPTSIQTANQIQEVTNLLNQGIKTIELQPISAEVFDQIPKQHFKEINRLTKLTGAETTVHAPIIDPAGFTKEGWTEIDREAAERQLKSIVERSHDLSPKGNMPVTIHASGIPGSEWMPGKTEEGEPRFKEKQIIAVNQETGQLIPIKREERYYPTEIAEKYPKEVEAGEVSKIKPIVHEPKEELRIINQSEWHQNLTQTLFYKNRGDEILEKYYPVVKHVWQKAAQGKKPVLTETQEAALGQIYNANEYYENSRMVLNSLYSKAFKYGTEEDKKKLLDVAKDFKEEMKGGPDRVSQALQNLITGMQQITPSTYIPVEDFAKQKAAQTLGNVALDAYKKYGENSPIISIENLFPGMAFSRSEQMKSLVEAARKKFVEQAKKQGISGAEDAAKKLIGVTWDVGHLNILRKEGFKTEDIIKETEAIAKYVKHVHLTDNFGFSDSHLPPGMGNVPIKEILQKLEKAGFTGKTAVEAGGFVQHFKTSPHPYVLESLGSPIYSMIAAPYWNQAVSTFGSYFAFPMAYFPEQHVSMYGLGFSNLPREMGGQIPGKQSRLAGAPME